MRSKNLFYFLKYLFVLVFIGSAVGKLLDNRGFSAVIGTYQLLPDDLTLFVGLSVSLFELFLGVSILLNHKLKLCAQTAIAVHIGYLTLASITLWRGINLINCGCFGVFWARSLSYQTVIEDVVLILLSILFYKTVLARGVTNEE